MKISNFSVTKKQIFSCVHVFIICNQICLKLFTSILLNVFLVNYVNFHFLTFQFLKNVHIFNYFSESIQHYQTDLVEHFYIYIMGFQVWHQGAITQQRSYYVTSNFTLNGVVFCRLFHAKQKSAFVLPLLQIFIQWCFNGEMNIIAIKIIIIHFIVLGQPRRRLLN